MPLTPRAARILRRVLLGIALLAILAVAGFTYMVGGPRNLVGMLRYDQRQEGTLRVGDPAPDATLIGLDGATRASLLADQGGKPLVLIFGSFT
jgi:hypothetical protein